MGIVQIGVLGVVGTLLAVHLGQGRAEYGTYIKIAVSVLIFYYILSSLKTFTETIQTIQSYIDMDTGYFALILKMIGVTYITEFTAGICRDGGMAAVGTQIEIVGKLTIFAISLPVLLALIETIQVFLA
ncbi:SpoIIIAC/SpoIIIAD family protein [Hespellia stercorisuis]|uniref:Stage III sporulation protein AD n=1 Tax=Hespellia stercorisuis DSM 15480 TaxID=1121950 RepID=A0A1M6HNZ5_9FIRM|nr:SpoIIIAC/SpoIIIAD family protein [Hespellia stercorisuis]SHJ23927.1 stage III sporulation protein AD [Hespellia stercorisuis DSM 15480]